MRRFVDRYGARPTHLLAQLGCFAIAAYAASFLLGDPALLWVLGWFVGAAVVHDLVLFPLYSTADRALARLPRRRVPVVNHVRVPLLGAGLTFLVFLPGVIRQGGATHLAATGLDQQPYLGRWLVLVAAMAGLSALVYLVRLARVATRPSAAGGSPRAPGRPAPRASTGRGEGAHTGS